MSYHPANRKTSFLQVWTRLTGILLASCLLFIAVTVQAAYPQNPLLHDETIYVSHQGIFKFHREQREPLWSTLNNIQTFDPVLIENLLLVGSSRGLYALDPETGSMVWHIESEHTVFSPHSSDKSGVTYAGSLHGELYAIKPRDGSIEWRQQFDGWIYSPVIDDKTARLWTGGQKHQLYAIDSQYGRLLHQITTTQESVFSPQDIGGNQIAFNLFDGSTVVVDMAAAKVKAIISGDSTPSGIHAVGDNLYRSHRDGTLSAFNRQSFALGWRRTLAPRDLVMHPSQPGHLFLGDNGRSLVLLDLTRPGESCQIQHDLPWWLPLHYNKHNIIHFQKTIQPGGMVLIQTEAQCR